MTNPSPRPDPTHVDLPVSAPGDDNSALAAFAASGVIAGAVAGLVWGGFGGRIAMRVVFLTSNDGARGLTSDDGFEIGTISSATMFLVAFSVIFGGIAGFAVGIIRMITAGPTWAVAIGTSLAAAAYAGAGIAHRRCRLPTAPPALVDRRAVRVDPCAVGCNRRCRHGPTPALRHQGPSNASPPPLLGCDRVGVARRRHNDWDAGPRCRHLTLS